MMKFGITLIYVISESCENTFLFNDKKQCKIVYNKLRAMCKWGRKQNFNNSGL